MPGAGAGGLAAGVVGDIGASHDSRGRECTQGRVVVVQCQAQLLEIVGALCPAGGLACRLDRGQQQRDEDADDGDHHQEFHKCETEISDSCAWRRAPVGVCVYAHHVYAHYYRPLAQMYSM